MQRDGSQCKQHWRLIFLSSPHRKSIVEIVFALGKQGLTASLIFKLNICHEVLDILSDYPNPISFIGFQNMKENRLPVCYNWVHFLRSTIIIIFIDVRIQYILLHFNFSHCIPIISTMDKKNISCCQIWVLLV